MLEVATLKVETANKIYEEKEKALKVAEKLPSKAKFDEFASRFKLEEASSRVEDRFLQKFKSGHSDVLAMLVFLFGSTMAIYVYLYINFTDPYWKLNETIRELPSE